MTSCEACVGWTTKLAEPSFDDTHVRVSPRKTYDRHCLLRVALAALAAIGVDLLVWSQRSTHLAYPIDAIGYPSFANYDYLPSFLRYELLIVGFPVGLCLAYLVLDWVGPLASRPRWQRKQLIPLTVPEQEAGERRAVFSPGDVWRVLVPLALVAISVRSRAPSPAASASGLRLLFILVYVAAVAIGTRLMPRSPQIRARGWTLPECFCVTSAALEAVAVFAGLWFVSHRTAVQFQNGALRSWPWIPWWFSVLGIILTFWWIARRLAAGARPESVERIVRVVLVGSALVYLLTATIPGPVQGFAGFDDAQSLVGATLLQHGYFPWRDFQIIHGPFVDIFEALIGFVVFQHSVWGQSAAMSLVLVPLTYVCFYLLAAWATRCRSVVIVVPVLLFVSGILLPFDPRLFPLPLMLILLGQTLKSPHRRWIIGLTLAMLAGVILIPETAFQAVPIALVVIVADVVHRTPGTSLLTGLRRTQVMVVTGLVAVGVWFVFLAAEGAAGGFVRWFEIFIPGHLETGVDPPLIGPPYTTLFAAVVAVTILTLLAAAWRIYRQLSWSPLAWVGLAAALNAAIYGEQALMRPDPPHYLLSIEAGATLLMIAGAYVIPAIDRRLGVVVSFERRSLTGTASRLEPFGLACLAAILLCVPGVLPGIQDASSRTTIALGPLLRNSPFGYATPTSMDPGLYPDLKRILKTYVPRGATFYDLTAAPGWFYYLLHMRPASTLTNITQADTSSLLPSKMIINGIARTRPPLIAFADRVFGLPVYDGILNEVRDYVVSQYVLDHYTPVFESHTVLFMARNDLVSHLRPLPRLSQPPLTTDLYNQYGACAWGYSANYLPSPQTGPAVTIPAASAHLSRRVAVRGWAYDRRAQRPAKHIVVVSGGRAMFTLPTGQVRPDVAKVLETRTATLAGYAGAGTVSARGPISVYEENSDGLLHALAFDGRMPPRIAAVKMPDGSAMKVGAAGSGSLDDLRVSPPKLVSSFPIPVGTSLKSVQLATFHAARPFGTIRLALSDTPNFRTTTGSPSITANTLPLTGRRLPVRVGACLQWHGYTHRTLYVQEPATGSPVTSITLSDVANVG